MEWNPDIYNKFKSERFEPFNDLVGQIQIRPDMAVVDLGCGTGELTRKLTDLLPGSSVLGIDSSPEMLNDSNPLVSNQVSFENRSIEEQLNTDQKWDLIFSNAAIQWVDNHEDLIPKIISKLHPGGQIAIQIPDQPQNITNQLLEQLAEGPLFRGALQHWKRSSPVLDIDAYAHLLFANRGKSIRVFKKIYPIVVQDSEAIFDWVSGTALLPYLSNLSEIKQVDFMEAYKSLLRIEFSESPAFYPFKRILMVATF